MDELADIYDRAFFAEHGAGNPAYAAACAFIAEELHRRFEPETVVDWGCGAGLHAAALARCGARVIAVDGVIADPDLRTAELDIVQADLRAPVDPALTFERYDLSLCLDVLEHLDEAHADQALANVTRGAGTVILSCAPPHQGGHHHVNEQPRRYWVARMAALGWRYDRPATGAMERHFLQFRDRLPTWMYHNLCIYRPAAGYAGSSPKMTPTGSSMASNGSGRTKSPRDAVSATR